MSNHDISAGVGDVTLSGLTLADSIFETLLARIYQGVIASGAILNEVALAEEFKVSRGPVREAIRRLQGIRLVTREPYVRGRVANLTADAAQELFEMRLALEGIACRLAAERMTDSEIQALLTELEDDRNKTVRGKSDVDSRSVFDFHERIVGGCKNSMIYAALCGDLYHLLRMYRRKSGAVPERKETAYAEHWQIIRAIRARDGELAESLMRAHVSRAAEHLFKQLPRSSDLSIQAFD